MSREFLELLDDAKAAGFTVEVFGNHLVEVLKKHHRTGKVIRGLVVYPNGWAVDARVDLGVAKSVRSIAAMRSILGIRK